MKKKITGIFVIGLVSLSLLSGCGGTTASTSSTVAPPEATEASEAAEVAAAADDGSAEASDGTEAGEATDTAEGKEGEWEEISEELAREACTRLFKAPEGATDIKWSALKGSEKDSSFEFPMVRLDFKIGSASYTALAQAGVPEGTVDKADSVEWTEDSADGTLAFWGDGKMPAKFYYAENTDKGMGHKCSWFDVEIGIDYSLSVFDKDLDGFDIQAVVESMYSTADVESSDMPNCFVDTASGKTEYESYDELISYLKEGQGYAYIKLDGYDGDILVVTDLVFEDDHSAYEGYLYALDNGKVKYLSLVSGNGSSYPLRIGNGLIYGGDNHNYESYFLRNDSLALMAKDVVSDDVATDGNGYTGFLRDSADYDHDEEFTGGQEEFDKLLAERDAQPIIEFTMVGGENTVSAENP